MYEMLFCFCILLHWRVFLPLVESSCQIWFPMLTFAFLFLPLLRKTDVKIRKQTEKRETKRKQETVFYVFLRVSLANIGKFKLSLKALILSAFTFICFLVFSNAFRRTKIFSASYYFHITKLANFHGISVPICQDSVASSGLKYHIPHSRVSTRRMSCHSMPYALALSVSAQNSNSSCIILISLIERHLSVYNTEVACISDF